MQRKTSHTRVKNEGKKRFFFRWEKKENERTRISDNQYWIFLSF